LRKLEDGFEARAAVEIAGVDEKGEVKEIRKEGLRNGTIINK
jgi:carbamoylphosphate synthase small subunit